MVSPQLLMVKGSKTITPVNNQLFNSFFFQNDVCRCFYKTIDFYRFILSVYSFFLISLYRMVIVNFTLNSHTAVFITTQYRNRGVAMVAHINTVTGNINAVAII